MKYVLMFLTAGGLVTIINLAAEKNLTKLAGILVFMPVVAITSYFFIWYFQGSGQVRSVVSATFWSLPPLLIFLSCLWISLHKFPYPYSVAFALLAWLLSAYIILAR